MSASNLHVREMIDISTRMQDERSGAAVPRQINESAKFSSSSSVWSECHKALSKQILHRVAKTLGEQGMHIHYADEHEVIAEGRNASIIEVYRKDNGYVARLTSSNGTPKFEEFVDSEDDVLNIAKLM